jgi:hypothetical protein
LQDIHDLKKQPREIEHHRKENIKEAKGGKQGKKNVQTCGKMRFLVKANVTNKEPSQPPSQ